MRRTQLFSTVAAVVLLGTGAATAQGVNGPVKPERAPAAQQSAPAEKMAPNMHAGQRGRETTGQGSAETLKPGSGGNAELNRRGTVGESPQSEDHGGKMNRGEKRTRDETQHSRPGSSHEVQGQPGGRHEMQGQNDNERTGSHERARSSDHGGSNQSANEGFRHEGKHGTTGQGAAAGAGKLSHEQRSKITSVFHRHHAKPTHLDISVHVGARIPSHVHFYAVPREVVVIYPEWRGYDYIMVGDQIVIVDPETHEVVAILDA